MFAFQTHILLHSFITLTIVMTTSIFGGVAFGVVRLTGNSNVEVDGDNNLGYISNNSKMKVRSENSTLTLFQNSNVKISVENAVVEVIQCSNIEISGKRNHASLTKNNNGKLSGNENKWEASSNSNLKVSGDNSNVKVEGNSNVSLEGNEGQVVAVDNSNLKVFGDGNKIVVKGTRNHCLTRATAENGQINKLEILPNSNQGLVSSFFVGRSNCPTYKIEYVEEAIIVKEEYQLGIFKFHLEIKGENQHWLHVDETGLDPSSLMSSVVGENEVVFSATKGGVKQEFKLKGSKVTEKSVNEFIISLIE